MGNKLVDVIQAADMATIKRLRDETRVELYEVSQRFDAISRRFNECASEIEDLHNQILAIRDTSGWSNDSERRFYRDKLREMNETELRALIQAFKSNG